MTTISTGDSYSFSIVLREVRGQWRTLAFVVLLMLLGTASALVTPLLLRELIDRAIPNGDTAMILALVVAMTLLPVVDVGLGLVRNYARASVGEAVTRRLRTDLFNHLIYARLDDIERTRLGHIVTVLTRSCGRVGEMFVAQTVVQSIYHSMLVVVTAGIMFTLNWKLALITLLAFPLSYLLARVAGSRERTVVSTSRRTFSRPASRTSRKSSTTSRPSSRSPVRAARRPGGRGGPVATGATRPA